MKTSALLKLHQRQVDLLDMIVKCGNYKRGMEADKRMYESYTDRWAYVAIITHCEKMIERYTAIKQRLIRYYLDIQKRINSMQPTIELNTISEMDLVTVKS